MLTFENNKSLVTVIDGDEPYKYLVYTNSKIVIPETINFKFFTGLTLNLTKSYELCYCSCNDDYLNKNGIYNYTDTIRNTKELVIEFVNLNGSPFILEKNTYLCSLYNVFLPICIPSYELESIYIFKNAKLFVKSLDPNITYNIQIDPKANKQKLIIDLE